VCRRWRDAAVAVVRPPAESGKITFPSSLKQVRTEDGSCCLGYVARACSVNRGTQLPIQCAMVWLCAFYGRF
jgi:hypothetical protein